MQGYKHFIINSCRCMPSVPQQRSSRERLARTDRRDSHRLDVSNGCGAAKDPHVGGEGWLEARLALLALQGLNQRSLLPTDVGPRATVHEHVKVVAGATSVLANQTSLVGLQ